MTRQDRPVLLAVDDDRAVLGAVERDLRRRYAADYRIVALASAPQALEALRELRRRGDAVALLLVDQRMPQLTGTQLLAEARELVPDARAVLLTAYADTQAAIDAINTVHLDHYILKPWDPPEERLYPVLDDLLEEWQATSRRPRSGIRIVGDRWSAASHDLRDFLGRNQIPFQWHEVGRSADADELLRSAPQVRLPAVFLDDGSVLSAPAPAAVAKAAGMAPRSGTDYFDLVVVGAGPAGLAAAVYATSEGLSTAVVESEAPGGQAGTSSRIENYLGFPSGVSGADLTRRALLQARRFGAEVIAPRAAARLVRDDPYRAVVLDDGGTLRCSAVILAMGVQYRTLDAPGVADLSGRGVYYGATLTEASATNGTAVVVGGANSAGQAAVYLSRFASRVIVAVRGERPAMSQYLVDQIGAIDRIEVQLATTVAGVAGDGHLERVRLCDRAGRETTVDAETMFVFIGASPRTDWLAGAVARDARGFVLTGRDLVTARRWGLDRDPYHLEASVPATFAVGDVRAQSVKRIASAVGEGAVAVQFVHAVLQG